ncbi:hypothetical protein FDP41_004302 [Naegleria fowleri]|uniref:Uncharacterized protein n=1 Tax=Naegleria fowleri TaxID=5763 RepID=A0A6A5BF15_NAEFO|nr:uncharacterized protein FDP41_004302 [Naegleria fowleri]KAF0976403.1 hypothetical protein FDP41_004302 [Naegleria fowleri]
MFIIILKQLTPLETACYNGHLEIVKVLLEFPRIDVNRSVDCPLYYACEQGHLEIVKLLLQAKDVDVNKGTPLYAACKNGHVEIVKLLLNVEGINVYKCYPLQIALENRQMEVLKVLLVHNVEIDFDTCQLASQKRINLNQLKQQALESIANQKQTSSLNSNNTSGELQSTQSTPLSSITLTETEWKQQKKELEEQVKTLEMKLANQEQ